MTTYFKQLKVNSGMNIVLTAGTCHCRIVLHLGPDPIPSEMITTVWGCYHSFPRTTVSEAETVQ